MRGPRLRLLLALLVLTAFTLTVLDARGGGSPFSVLRRGADATLGPLQQAAGSAVRALPGGSTDEDVQRLQRDNDDLRRRVLELEGTQAQSEQLAQLLRLKDEGSYTTVLAQVVGYGAATPFEETVTVDVGSRDGVREDQAVTSGRGLVGRTVQVGPETSVVALLTDPTVTVGARLNTGARSFGLATGTGDGTLSLALVARGDAAALQVGQDLVTGGSDTYVPGVPVGRITAVAPAGEGVVPTATVAPYADLDALDLLQVVVAGPRTEPRVAIPPS